MVSLNKRIAKAVSVSVSLSALFYIIGSMAVSVVTGMPSVVPLALATVGFATPIGIALSEDVGEDETIKEKT